jgi:hypothetical protein
MESVTNAQLLTAPERNWRFSASYDSFVLRNRQLPKPAIRYRQVKTK